MAKDPRAEGRELGLEATSVGQTGKEQMDTQTGMQGSSAQGSTEVNTWGWMHLGFSFGLPC